MAASRIIVSENIEVPVVDGKMQCIRCKGWKLPDEMHFKDRTCQACYEAIRARNRGKPKPKKNNEKIIKRNGMGWIERVEKPTRTVGDSELAKMIVLERAVDRNMLPEPITVDGGRVADTKNGSMSEIDKESHSLGGVTVAATNEIQTDAPKIRSITFGGVRVADTANSPEQGIGKESHSIGGVTVAATNEKQIDVQSIKPITSDGVRVADTANSPKQGIGKESHSIGGVAVAATNEKQIDVPSIEPITSDGVRVADTANSPKQGIGKESHSIGGVAVAATNEKQIDVPSIEPITSDGVRVADTEKRLTELEGALGATNERLANALRKIRALEEKLEKLSPVIEKEEAKRDAANLQKLRDDLFKLLRERMEKSHTNGIYVHSLYGPNGRAGGKLNISKRQAFRLRDACRGDDRFKVEKTENQQGNWAILLNIHMR